MWSCKGLNRRPCVLLKRRHGSRCWHHCTPSSVSVEITSVQLIRSEQEEKINIWKDGQAVLISTKCAVTTQNWKQIRNAVSWFWRLSFPRVTFCLPSMPRRLAQPLMLRRWVRPVSVYLSYPPSPLEPSLLSSVNVLVGGILKENRGYPPRPLQCSLGSCAGRSPPADAQTTRTCSWFSVCVHVCVCV